jgi:hypothetical protein
VSSDTAPTFGTSPPLLEVSKGFEDGQTFLSKDSIDRKYELPKSKSDLFGLENKLG